MVNAPAVLSAWEELARIVSVDLGLEVKLGLVSVECPSMIIED